MKQIHFMCLNLFCCVCGGMLEMFGGVVLGVLWCFAKIWEINTD